MASNKKKSAAKQMKQRQQKKQQRRQQRKQRQPTTSVATSPRPVLERIANGDYPRGVERFWFRQPD